MLGREQYLELHTKFYDYFSSESLAAGCYLSYEDHQIPTKCAQGAEWSIFSSLAKDYTREILNAVNQYLSHLIRLEAWSRVLEEYGQENRFDIIVEIIEPLASNSINLSYAIKERIAFVSSSLLHQTFRLLNPQWKESDFDENRFYFTQVYGFLKKYKEYVGSSEKPDNLKARLDEIDSQTFREKTKEFRGRYQHMIPPNIEIGLSGLINRIVSKSGKVSYGIGGQGPISLRKIIPELCDQREKCSEAVKAFWELLQELLDVWKRERPTA